MPKYSGILIRLIVSSSIIAFLNVQQATAQANLQNCPSLRVKNYFIDSIQIERRSSANDILYIGYPKNEWDGPISLLVLSTKDSCIIMPGVITCNECIGRSTTGTTYKGAVIKGNMLILKQHIFDYDVEIHISMLQKIPIYSGIIIKSLKKTAGKATIRTCLPKRTIYLTELGFMSLDLDDKTLGKYFTIIRR